MAYRFTLLLIIMAGLLTACSGQKSSNHSQNHIIKNPRRGQWQDQKSFPVTFNLQQTYGNQTDLLLSQAYQLQGPVADSIGNVYVIDSKAGHLYSFDSTGVLRWKKGRIGKGPGEIQRAKGLASDGQFLYTANQRGTRIDKFDMQGNPVNSNPTGDYEITSGKVEGIINDSLLVVSSMIDSLIGNRIDLIDVTNLKDIRHFKAVSKPSFSLPAGARAGVDIKTNDSLIVLGNSGHYELTFYNEKGVMVKAVRRDFHRLVHPGIYQQNNISAVVQFSTLQAPVILKNGDWLVTSDWPTNLEDPDRQAKAMMIHSNKAMMTNSNNKKKLKQKNAIDLYNSKGKLLYSKEYQGSQPDIGQILYISPKGFLYTTSNNPFPQIRRYSVHVTAHGQ